MKKPSGKCYACGSNDWWQRPDGGWSCGKCHPNLNPGSALAAKEGHPPEVIIGKEHSPEVLALRDRVRLGNDKLFQAWLQIREVAGDEEEWKRQMDRLGEAAEKLRGFCNKLKLGGYTDCLYLENGKKTRPCLNSEEGSFWCQVCSSDIRYWEQELMAMPGHRVRQSSTPEQIEQKKFLEKLGEGT